MAQVQPMPNKELISLQDCQSENCYGCFFRLNDVGIDNCIDYKDSIKIAITKSIPIPIPKRTRLINDNHMLYIGIGSGFIIVSIVLIFGLIIYKKKHVIKSKLQVKINLDIQGRLNHGKTRVCIILE